MDSTATILRTLPPARLRSPAGLVLALALLAAGAPLPAAAMSSNVTWKAELAVKESFDSNVYLQDRDPAPANAAAARAAGLDPVSAKHESFVTSIQPRLSFDYKPCAEFQANLAYAPDIAFYHDASSEDYIAHSFGVNLGGRIGETQWDLKNGFIYIDGNGEGPTFARPGDIPAVGGIPMRNRREAFIYKNSFRVVQPLGEKFILRPVAAVYVHDFKTMQKTNSAPGQWLYENYIDRQDINGGLDLGYKAAEKTTLLIGYRYGRQNQYTLLGVKSPYDSSYHRILVGIEGAPLPWLKLSVMAGPDIRDYDRQLPAPFDSNELLYYVDAAVTFLPTERDSITLLNRRYQQPSFASHGMYEDITYDLAYVHKFSAQWTAGAGFQIYVGDWQAPANREDWIYTPRAFVGYAITDRLSAEIAYSYDWVESKVPNTEGREFTRHLVALGARYTF